MIKIGTKLLLTVDLGTVPHVFFRNIHAWVILSDYEFIINNLNITLQHRKLSLFIKLRRLFYQIEYIILQLRFKNICKKIVVIFLWIVPWKWSRQKQRRVKSNSILTYHMRYVSLNFSCNRPTYRSHLVSLHVYI